MIRQEREKGDSGWFLGDWNTEAPDDPGQYERLPTYDLVSRLPAAIPYLCLPEGYAVRFEGGRVTALLRPDGKDIWPASSSR